MLLQSTEEIVPGYDDITSNDSSLAWVASLVQETQTALNQSE